MERTKRNNNKTQRAKKPAGAAQPVRSNAPVATAVQIRTTKPKITSANGKTTVTYSEFVTDVDSNASDFAIVGTYPINPGLPDSFPWLNDMANSFESYKFKSLGFRFETSAPTSIGGYLALVPEFDPDDAAPLSKAQAFQYQNVLKTAPWKSAALRISPANLEKRRSYFTRADSSSQGDESLQTYDVGNLYIIAGGNGSTPLVLGELWADYVCEFSTPQSNPVPNARFCARVLGATAQTAAIPFGSAPTIAYGGTLPFVTITTVSGNSCLTFAKPGVYACNVRYVGTGIVSANATANSSDLVTTNIIGQVVLASGLEVSEQYRFTVLRAGGAVSMYSLGATTITTAEAIITPWSSSLT